MNFIPSLIDYTMQIYQNIEFSNMDKMHVVIMVFLNLYQNINFFKI